MMSDKSTMHRTAEDVRQMASTMTREELVAALIAGAEASDAAEALIDELRRDVAALDAVVSRHAAALLEYDAEMQAA